MATLHTVNKSPFDKNSLDSCLSVAKDDSSVLFIEDGVVAAITNTAASDKLTSAMSNGQNVYVLGGDLAARGLSKDRLLDGVKVVDYAGFVQLAVDHDRVQNWL